MNFFFIDKFIFNYNIYLFLVNNFNLVINKQDKINVTK